MKKTLLIIALIALSCMIYASTYTIGSGTGMQYNVPYNGIFNYGWSKTIYLASEINDSGFTAGDDIVGLGYQVGNTPSNYTMINQKVYIRNTAVNSYENNLAYPGTVAYTQVFEGEAITNGSGWSYTFFDTPFLWDGVSNLEILWENYNGWWMTGYPQFLFHETTGYKTVYRTNDADFPLQDGFGTDRRPNIQLVTEIMGAPGEALVLNPADGNHIWGDSARLNWVSGEGIVSGYKLYFGASNPPAYVADLGSDSNYIVSDLDIDTQYFWKVVPYNDFGEAADCPVWSFYSSPPWFDDFGVSSTDWPPLGWSQRSGIFPEIQYEGTQWVRNPWINGPSGNNAASIYLGSQATRGWLITPKIEAPGAGLVLEFDLGHTHWGAQEPIHYPGAQPDDKFIVAVADNPLFENPVILREWNNTDSDDVLDLIPHTGMHVSIPFAEAGDETYFIFYAESTIDNSTNELFIDNVKVTLMPTNPILSYYPSEIDFDEVRYDYHNPPQMVRVQNSGVGNLVLNEQNLYFTGNHSAHFHYDESVLPIQLYTGESVYLPVYSNSVVEGVNSANLVINYDGVEHTVALSATVLPKGMFYIGDDSVTTILPVRASFFYTHSQSIYLQSEIDIQGTQIEKLSYFWTGPAAIYSNDWTIYMGHTQRESFTTEDDWEDAALMSKVFEGHVPLPSYPGWVEIVLDKPFPYNNVDNLVIAIDENAIYSDFDAGYFVGTPTPETRSLQYYNNEINPDPYFPRSGSRYAGIPNVRLQTQELEGAGKPHLYVDSLFFEDVYYGAPGEEKLLFVANKGAQSLILDGADIEIRAEQEGSFAFDESVFPLTLESGFALPIPIWVDSSYQGMNDATITVGQGGDAETIPLNAEVLPNYMLRFEIGESEYVNTSYTFPSPYVSRIRSYRQQYLYRASELLALDAREGLINAISFHVNEVDNCQDIFGYTIRIKHTDMQALGQNYEAGQYQTVYYRDAFLPVNGWNRHDFDTPFMWNGQSNIIIDITSLFTDHYYDGNQTNAIAFYTTTDFNSSLIAGSNEQNAVNAPTGMASQNRADIRFYMTGISMGSLSGMVLENGRALGGAKIEVEQTLTTAYSSDNGYYHIDYLPAGEYSIVVSKHNYESQRASVVIAEGENAGHNFDLVGMPQISISDSEYNFGYNTVSESKMKEVEIANIGGGELVISSIELSGSDAFILEDMPNLPRTLFAGQSIVFNVRFMSAHTGAHSAIITINDGLDALHSAGFAQRNSASHTQRAVNSIDVYGFGVNSLTIGSGNQLARIPLDVHWTQSMFQTIYPREELEFFDGLITGVSFYNSFVSSVFNKPVRIWLGSTNLTNLQNGWISSNHLTMVYDDLVYFPLGQHKIQISFPEPYRHDNSGNLVMLVQRPSDWTYFYSNDAFYVQTEGTNRSRTMSSDGAEYNPANMTGGSLVGTFPKTTFDLIPGDVGQITGVVKDDSNQPLEDVRISISTRDSHVYSDDQGRYALRNLLPNNYNVSFSKQGYYAETAGVAIAATQMETLNMTLSPIPTVSIFGTITAANTGQGLGGAKIRLSGYADFVAESEADGSFSFDPVVYIDQEYEYRITAPGYLPISGSISLGESDYDMGAITLEEGLFASPSLKALTNASYTETQLTWEAPMQNANSTDAAANLSGSRNSELSGYMLWRITSGDEEDEDSWTALGEASAEETGYTDESWASLAEGDYRWAIKAIYNDESQSLPTFSNVLIKTANPGTIFGYVLRASDQAAIVGASVIANDAYAATTDEDGYYSLILPQGSYTFAVSHIEYNRNTFENIQIVAGEESTRDFILTHVDVEDGVASFTTQLRNNYPNPFNPETTISYSLKDQGMVSLQVFNLKGQLVKTLVNGSMPAGEHSTVFTARDRNGNKLSSGIYFYRLQTEGFSQTRKMMLME